MAHAIIDACRVCTWLSCSRLMNPFFKRMCLHMDFCIRKDKGQKYLP